MRFVFTKLQGVSRPNKFGHTGLNETLHIYPQCVSVCVCVCVCVLHIILATDDATLHQWLTASRRFGRSVSYRVVSARQLLLHRISLLALKQLDDDTPDGNPTVVQLITSTRTFIVVVTKAGYSSIYSTPTDPPLSRIHHGSPRFLTGT
jgi:hypothetical protein